MDPMHSRIWTQCIRAYGEDRTDPSPVDPTPKGHSLGFNPIPQQTVQGFFLNGFNAPAEGLLQVGDKAPRENGVVCDPALISRSRSLSGRASPRPNDPKTLTLVTP